MASEEYMTEKYETFTWEDETSQFDLKGRWQYGTECYLREYKCRVPKRIVQFADYHKDDSIVHKWIEKHNYDEIWMDDEVKSRNPLIVPL